MLCLDDLARLVERYSEDLKHTVRSFDVGGKIMDFSHAPQLMGVVNLSPDSWYRESVCLSLEHAVQRGQTLVTQGAAIVDVGAESSILNASRADADLQQSRLVPVVASLSDAGVIVSVETYHPSVAQAGLEAGAAVLNITGPGHARELFRMAADHGAAVIICYVQGENVREVGDLRLGDDPIPDMMRFFEKEIKAAESAGVERIFVDPGLGFYYRNLTDSSERVAFQMQTFLNTFRLRRLGWPVCHALPHAAEFFREEVRCAEPFFATLAALGKTSLFRTHEVARTRAVLETMRTWRS